MHSCFYIKGRHFSQKSPLRKTEKVPVPRLCELSLSSHSTDSSHSSTSPANGTCYSKRQDLFMKCLHRKMYRREAVLLLEWWNSLCFVCEVIGVYFQLSLCFGFNLRLPGVYLSLEEIWRYTKGMRNIPEVTFLRSNHKPELVLETQRWVYMLSSRRLLTNSLEI